MSSFKSSFQLTFELITSRQCRTMNRTAVTQSGKHVGQKYISVCINRKLCDVSISEVYYLATFKKNRLMSLYAQLYDHGCSPFEYFLLSYA